MTLRDRILEILSVEETYYGQYADAILSLVTDAVEREVENARKDYEGFCQAIEAMGKKAHRHGAFSQAQVDGRDALAHMMCTRLKQMRKEK